MPTDRSTDHQVGERHSLDVAKDAHVLVRVETLRFLAIVVFIPAVDQRLGSSTIFFIIILLAAQTLICHLGKQITMVTLTLLGSSQCMFDSVPVVISIEILLGASSKLQNIPKIYRIS